MFKDEKKRNTLTNELTRKSTFDIIVLFIIFLVLYMVFEYAELDTTLMSVTIVFLFILSLLSFEFTKKQL